MSEKTFQLKLYNTKTRQKEAVFPIDGKQITFYACGPTVYDYAHIGNFRTYVFEDLIRRVLEFFGFKVKMVMNITDVDDKTIQRAFQEKVDLNTCIQPFLKAFFEDLHTLHIKPADLYPRATQFIDSMIEIILDLLQKGYAYNGSDGSIYFSIKKFSKYGKLSHLKLKELKEGASKRVASDEYEKEEASDFVLWKAYDEKRDGDIYWESPFGKGRPGWHLECSTMAMKILGKSIDLHTGGVDNIFPHHENEIAQSECHSGREFAKIWAHAAHLIVDNKKMSKSLKNFYTLRDLLQKGYTGKHIRYMLMHTHYRVPLNFTFQGMDGMVLSMQRLENFIHRISEITKDQSYQHTDSELKDALIRFSTCLADDLNISAALAVIFDLIRHYHFLCDQNILGKEDRDKILQFLARIDQVLCFLPLQPKELEVPVELNRALEQREIARKNKDWSKADGLRDFIHEKGYKIEDGSQGPVLKKR